MRIGRIRTESLGCSLVCIDLSDEIAGRHYNFTVVHSPRYIAGLIAFWLAVAAPSFVQTTANKTLDERIRQADALQDKGNLKDARNIYEAALKTLRMEGASRQL